MQRLDEHAPAVFVSFAVGLATVVDPARRVAALLAVDDVFVVNVKVKRVIRVAGVMRVTAQCLFPTDNLAAILDQRLAFSEVFQCVNTFAMDTRAAHLDAPGIASFCSLFGLCVYL